LAHVADPFGSSADATDRATRWSRRLADSGPTGALRHAVARLLLGPSAGRPRIDDGHLLMQLRAAHGYFEGIAATERRRKDLEAIRSVPDREILTRFPRLVVPTYAGDEEFFESNAFQSLLPSDWPLEFVELDSLMDLEPGG
jgi:hypothetical protein